MNEFNDLDEDTHVNCGTGSVVYEMFVAWLLQDNSNKPTEYYKGELLVRKIENVRMVDRYNSSSSSSKQQLAGTLYLTTTMMMYVHPDSMTDTWVRVSHIASVEKLPLSTLGSSLIIRCKNFQSLTLVIPKERECQLVHSALSQLCRPASFEHLNCFFFKPTQPDIPKPAGWNFYDLQSEYQRMRVPNDQWALTHLNQNYDLCDTYPSSLFVPTTATSKILLGSSRFRSKGRLPVLSYLHKNNAAICRCSQPLSGFSARCVEDERMLEAILGTNNASFMYVVDTRPRINAMANRATGKGYENENFYENIKFQFLGIENIHVMRSSLAKMLETCQLSTPSMHDFLSGLESSGWLKHIRSVLDTSHFIAQAVDKGVSVVVHCSDGWDRTAQVCSLASVLLDPHYRTFLGFEALIEKDWLAFGHKFTERLGHVMGDVKEISPVFTQFIEATWQLMEMFPTAFQFNERFLLTIHDHSSSCQYGTFVGNCEKDRVDLRLKDRTYSLWGLMANHMHQYMNPLYDAKAESGVLNPSPLPQAIKFWRGMYCRFDSGIHPREPIRDILLSLFDHSVSLQEHVALMQTRVSSLKTLLADHSNNLETGGDKLISREKDNRTDYVEEEKINSLSQNIQSLSLKQEKDVPTAEKLHLEVESVALDWKLLRKITSCRCSVALHDYSPKIHCWRCGEILCERCMLNKLVPLPGHLTKLPVPVCQLCDAALRNTGSP